MSVAHMFSHVFLRIHTALFPVFREEFNFNLQQMGLIASIPSLCQTLAIIPSGLLADRFGHRNVIALSFLIAGASSIFLSYSYNVILLTTSLSLLILTSSLYHPAAYSLTSELSTKKHRAKALGVHGAGGTLGIALGPITVSLLIGSYGWRPIYLLWAFPILFFILAIFKLNHSKNNDENQSISVLEVQTGSPLHESARSVLTVGFLTLLFAMSLRMIGTQIIGTFLPTYLHDVMNLSVAEGSLIYGLMPFIGIFAAPIGGFFADRIGDKRWMMISYFGSALFTAFSSLSPNVLLFSAFYMCYGFFFFSSMGAASSLIARFTPRSSRGMGYALYFLPVYLMGTIAPIVGAYVAENFGLWSIFPIAVAGFLMGLILLKIGVS